MTIFLIAEVTAVAILIKYISGIKLWVTAAVVILSSLIYTLYGGLRASIFTDKIQFIFTKIGLFFVFLFFILGPPVYHISTTEVTFSSYMSNVLKFEGEPEEEGYLKYLYNNKTKIIQVLLSFGLVIYIFFKGKKLKFKIKEKRREKKLRKLEKAKLKK